MFSLKFNLIEPRSFQPLSLNLQQGNPDKYDNYIFPCDDVRKINEQFFGLYLCTSEPKGYDNRFKEKKYCVKQGDKIKISDTVLEVKFHI